MSEWLVAGPAGTLTQSGGAYRGGVVVAKDRRMIR